MASCAAVSADTSSAAAGTTPVVGAAAAAFWALIDEPIPCKVPAAAVSASGCVDTNDMRFSSWTWTDPRSARSGRCDVRSQRSWAAEVQTDDSALGHYTYFLADVHHIRELIVSTFTAAVPRWAAGGVG